ncbi:glutathione S-transferase family protein [Thalassomonas viridans]|uniref:glutathione S-transferase family protein n=1 Tax=Thalassomonas viridans TaxID=137584 RepID=UPI000ACA8842|nr:glutathione S-transferase domain-containing protein [Thalassomonas viridans]
MQCSAQRSPDAATLAERNEKLGKAFEKAEKILGKEPYFKSKTLSNVDIAWLPLLHRTSVIKKHSCYDFLEKYPKVKAWREAVLNTGLAEKSVADDFIEAFTGFYLADTTYLGKGEDCPPSIGPCPTDYCC